MSEQTETLSVRQLARVVIATLLVAGCPVAIVWWLRASGLVSSALLGALLGMALSLGVSHVARVIWEKRTGSEDVLFSELMLWGFAHRRLTQRRLSSALDLLGPMGAAQQSATDTLSTKEQARLLERLVSSIETRDPYTHGHSRRVARHAWMIAKHMGLSRAEVARIRTAAALHDVGKVETPRAILHKAGKLTDEEYDAIKKHPVDGARMASVLRDAELTAIVLHHHERLDGTGYPAGLRGEEIPLGARIISVADTFDAITSARPYRPARPHRQAIDILKREAGTQLDPAVVKAFCSHYAGRRPLALWSSMAGLPERVLTWLGGSLTSVASAAKAVAVATLVGGVAVTASTLTPPPGAHHRRLSALAPVLTQQLQVTDFVSRAPSATRAPTSARHPHRAAHRRRSGVRAPSSPPTAAEVQAAVPGGDRSHAEVSAPGGSGGEGASGKGEGKEPAKGKSEEASGVGGGEAPGTKSSEEAAGKSEEAHGKSEEASGRSEEPHGKAEESSGKGASEEAHGRSEEAAGRNKAEEKAEKSK